MSVDEPRELKVATLVTCRACKGSGRSSRGAGAPCSTCEGFGVVSGTLAERRWNQLGIVPDVDDGPAAA